MKNVEISLTADSLKKDVVVLIPSYNRARDLVVCLDCLEKHTDDHKYDLLIVDDCSPEYRNIVEATAGRLARHPAWEMISIPKNGGFTKCVNYGVRYLQKKQPEYKYVLLLNNDAVVGHNWLERMVPAFDDPKDVGVVAPFAAVWCADSIYPTPIGWDKPYSMDGQPWNVRDAMILHTQCSAWYEEHVGFWGVLIRFDLFRRYGLFDEQFQVLWQDVDWCWRIQKYGWKVKVLNDTKDEPHLIFHTGKTHKDLKPLEEVTSMKEQDDRLIREIWPEKWDHQLSKRQLGKR